MTIKLLILKSGEEMISDISEMAVGEEDEQKVIGYFLRRPCLVKMKNPGLIDKNEAKVGNHRTLTLACASVSMSTVSSRILPFEFESRNRI